MNSSKSIAIVSLLLCVCFASVVVFCEHQPYTSQTCSGLGLFNTHSALKNCLEGIPFNETIKFNTLNSLLKIVDSYVFVDISKSSPSSNILMNVHIEDDLTNLLNENFASDSDFQQKVADVFTPLQDAHTRYSKPSIYQYSTFVQPFDFSSRIITLHHKPTQIIVISPNPIFVQRYQEVYGVEIMNFTALQVQEIDGEDALEHIIEFAYYQIGYSKDLGVRFNFATTGFHLPGSFAFRPQTNMGIPINESITYVVSEIGETDPSNFQTLDINWIGVYSPPNVQKLEKIDPKRRRKMLEIDILNEMYRDTVVDESGGVTVEVIQKNIGVLKIPTFGPASTQAFVAAVANGMNYLQNQGAAKLIIDLRKNGGGDICLGYGLLRYLFPQLMDAQIVGTYDLKHSDLFVEMARKGNDKLLNNQNITVCGVDPEVVGYFIPCAWYNATIDQAEINTNEFYTYFKDSISLPPRSSYPLMFHDITWFLPGKTYLRGDTLSNYSTLIHEGCESAYTLWTPPTQQGFSVSDTIILSDGLCGSTCAVFSRFIQQYGLAKSVSIGGLLTSYKQTFSSFPGGEVEDLTFITQLATKYNVSEDLIPQPLENGASFRFAIREIYPWGTSSISSENPIPLEFIYQPADFHILYDESGNNSDVWVYDYTAQFFSNCSWWQTQPCFIQDGVGVNECVDSQYSHECTLLYCNEGFHEEHYTCSEIEISFVKREIEMSIGELIGIIISTTVGGIIIAVVGTCLLNRKKGYIQIRSKY